MSLARMFFRKQTQSYYVKIGGKFVPLGKDEKAAREKYAKLLPPEFNAETAGDVQSLIFAYLDFLAANRSAGTFAIVRPHLASFAEYVGPLFSLDGIRGLHLQQWADRRFAPPLSPSYKNQGMRVVKGCWAWGARMGLIPGDTLQPVRLPTPGQREVFVPIDQWRTIVDAVDGPFRDYLIVAFESGLRPQEIHLARVRHFQPQQGTLIWLDQSRVDCGFFVWVTWGRFLGGRGEVLGGTMGDGGSA